MNDHPPSHRLIDPRVQALCDEFSIRSIGGQGYPEPGQTRAPVTILRIIDKHGEAHARMVLMTLAETFGNSGLINEVTLWAVSDLVLACPRWADERPSEWLDAWDKVPLGRYEYLVNELRGISSQRHALAGLCYVHLRSTLDPEYTLARFVWEKPERGKIAPHREAEAA